MKQGFNKGTVEREEPCIGQGEKADNTEKEASVLEISDMPIGRHEGKEMDKQQIPVMLGELGSQSAGQCCHPVH